MSIGIGSLIASIGGDIGPLRQALAQADAAIKDAGKKVDKTMEDVGKKMSSIGKNMTMYITLPLLAVGGAAIKFASDYEESLNKVNVAFKESSGVVQEWAKTSLTNFGMASGSALEMTSLFGDMATSMGLTTGQAAKMSVSLAGLAGDLASFKNINIEQAQTALAGIFTGETESLKRLGFVMTEQTLQEYALAEGITKRYTEMTQAEKVQLRYNYIMKVSANAQGDFVRTQEGAANQTRIFMEGIKQLAASFGKVMLPAYAGLMRVINGLIQGLGAMSDTGKMIVVVIGAIVASIGPLLMVIGFLVTNLIPMFTAGLVAVRTAFLALSTAFLTNPLGWLAVALAAAAAALLIFTKKTTDAKDEQLKLNSAINKVNTSFAENTLLAKGAYLLEGIGTGAITATFSIERLSKALTKMSKNELEAVKALMINKLEDARRALLNAGDAAEKLFQTGQIATYKESLALVTSELTKLEEVVDKTAPKGRLTQLADEIKALQDIKLTAPIEALAEINDQIIELEKEVDHLNSLSKTITYTPPTIFSPQHKNTPIPSPIEPKSLVFMDEYGKAMERVTTMYGLFSNVSTQMGVDFDITGQKLNTAKGALQALTGEGIFPTKEAIAEVTKDIQKLEEQQGIENMAKKAKEALIDLTNSMKTLIAEFITTVIVDFAEMIGEAIAGGNIENAFMKIISSFGGFMKQMGAMMIAYGVTQEAFWASFGLGPVGAVSLVIAGAAMVVIGSAISSLANKSIPGMAEGGIVPKGFPNDSYLAWLSSDETVIPAKTPIPLSGNRFSGNNNSTEVDVRVFGTLTGEVIALSSDRFNKRRNQIQ